VVSQVWTKPQHQNQQPELVEQEQLLSYRSTTELAPLPNHTITTAPNSAMCSHSVELEELAGDDDEEAEELLQIKKELAEQLRAIRAESEMFCAGMEEHRCKREIEREERRCKREIEWQELEVQAALSEQAALKEDLAGINDDNALEMYKNSMRHFKMANHEVLLAKLEHSGVVGEALELLKGAAEYLQQQPLQQQQPMHQQQLQQQQLH
jgi:hypothetical protein